MSHRQTVDAGGSGVRLVLSHILCCCWCAIVGRRTPCHLETSLVVVGSDPSHVLPGLLESVQHDSTDLLSSCFRLDTGCSQIGSWFPSPSAFSDQDSSLYSWCRRTQLVASTMLSLRIAAQRVPRCKHALRTFSHLNAVTEDDLAHFSTILPPSSVLSTLPPTRTSPEDMEPYNVDWMGKYHGQANTVLRPRTTQQVSEIVKYCADRRIGIVPQGGNTGLVGGSISLKKEVVLNLGAMSNVRSFDPVSGLSQWSCISSQVNVFCPQGSWWQMLDAFCNH